MFYAYLLRCADNTYYAGHTDNLDRRVTEHSSGALGVYTFKRRPIILVWSDTFQTRHEAKAAEAQIKGWTRAKKEALIAGDFALLSELAKCRTETRPSTGSGLRN